MEQLPEFIKSLNEVICWIKFFISQIITFGLLLFHLQARQKHVDEDVMKSGEQTAKSKMENMRPAPWSGSFASCVRVFCDRNSFLYWGWGWGGFFKWRMHPRRINETSIVFFFVMHHYEVVNLSARRISAHCRSSMEASSSSWGWGDTHSERTELSSQFTRAFNCLRIWGRFNGKFSYR